MKKLPRKLVLRSETIKTLNNIDLMRAGGGGDGRTQSGINCPVQDVLPTPK